MVSETICSNLYSLLLRIQMLITFLTSPTPHLLGASNAPKHLFVSQHPGLFSGFPQAAKLRTLLSQSSLVRRIPICPLGRSIEMTLHLNLN